MWENTTDVRVKTNGCPFPSGWHWDRRTTICNFFWACPLPMHSRQQCLYLYEEWNITVASFNEVLLKCLILCCFCLFFVCFSAIRDNFRMSSSGNHLQCVHFWKLHWCNGIGDIGEYKAPRTYSSKTSPTGNSEGHYLPRAWGDWQSFSVADLNWIYNWLRSFIK